MPEQPITALDLKQLYRSLSVLFETLDRRGGSRRMATKLAPWMLDHLGDLLDLRAAHAYRRRAESVTLVARWGADDLDLADEIRKRFPIEPGPETPELPWVGKTRGGVTAILPVDARDTHLLTLLGRGRDDDSVRLGQLTSAISAVHYALRQHLERGALEDLLQQARAIQTSLLPPRRPSFGDFDIAATSIPATDVGGDLYDFIPLDAETLAIAVADASGHGLPAALQARDVITGLRMGVERDLRITRMIEKLNRVIHRSGLASRFISLLFGELELNGNLSYINAGHPPALLLDDRGFHELTVGGMVLGPYPEAVYKLGFAHLDRGGALALYSDGVPEHGTAQGRPFGLEGLRAWMEQWRNGEAEAAVEDLVARLKAQVPGPFEDDLTILYVRRPR